MTKTEENLLNEMDRRFNLQSYEDDYLPNNDTQLGVEFAISFAAEQVAKALEQIEQSLPTDGEVNDIHPHVLQVMTYKDAIIFQRNQTQEAINKLKRG